MFPINLVDFSPTNMPTLPTPRFLQAYHAWADNADMVLTRCDQDGEQYQPVLPVIGTEYPSAMEVSLITFFSSLSFINAFVF